MVKRHQNQLDLSLNVIHTPNSTWKDSRWIGGKEINVRKEIYVNLI